MPRRGRAFRGILPKKFDGFPVGSDFGKRRQIRASRRDLGAGGGLMMGIPRGMLKLERSAA